MLPGFGFGGCAAPRPTMDQPIEIDVSEYANVFDASVRVLREQGNVIDRQDYRFGVITTKPLLVPTILELWHSTNRMTNHALASTFNNHRRTVRVTIKPPESISETEMGTSRSTVVESGKVYLFHVGVQIERLQIVTRYMSGSTAGNQVLKTLSSTPVTLAQRGISSSSWQSIGRDPVLEQSLTAAIIRTSTWEPSRAALVNPVASAP